MSSLHYKQCPAFDDALGPCQCDLIGEVKEETELKIMSTEGSLAWMADILTKAAREPLIEMIDELVQQACYVPADGMGEMYYDSMALSVYAEAMRFLAEEGRLVITSEYGRRVIAERVKDESSNGDT
jgi:hypothetical protein